jgi:L-malate glycosyltransferase
LKLLVVGHTYITAFAQAKYVAMKALRKDFAVRLVVPPVVRHSFSRYQPELALGLLPEELVVVRALGGTNTTYILDPVALGALMRRFSPTHVHIEEDPHSAVGFETACLAATLCPHAALSFFIWDNLNRVPRFPLNVVKRALTQHGLKRVRLMICGNNDARELLTAKGYRGASEVIPQVGLDPAAAGDRDVAKPTSPSEWLPTIGYLGRLVEEKGIRNLLQALEPIRDLRWQLVMHGNGPLRNEIEKRWQPALGDRLICLDAIPHAAVHAVLTRTDIFVLPSYGIPTWKEQFGLTLAQAMLAGCACIGSSSGAIPEVLGGQGLVFPERDVPALGALLRALLSSPAERARLGSAARTYAMAHYTNRAIAGRYLSAFDMVAN